MYNVYAMERALLKKAEKSGISRGEAKRQMKDYVGLSQPAFDDKFFGRQEWMHYQLKKIKEFLDLDNDGFMEIFFS